MSASCTRHVLPALLVSGILLSWGRAERATVSLDGQWEIEESVDADARPATFNHRVRVPGLVNLSQPAFPDVDAFESREYLANLVRGGTATVELVEQNWQGRTPQERNYFWYRRTFRAPAERAVARLKVNKAQFGTAVWLNGTKVGEYAGCFSAGYFDLADAIRWDEENEVIIRIGAHPAVLPDTYPAGTDFEKLKWTPGIYDSVNLIVCDNPLIETIQVAPRIATSEILIQTWIRNTGDAAVESRLTHAVKTWKGGREAGAIDPEVISLEPGEERIVTQTIGVADARLWSPEDPFLYVLESSTGGDSVETRFGMRELRFDGETRRAYLNGRPYFLRGSNIALHRFFEDPECGDLPWNEAWVRRLLGELPKQMHWNYFRFSIGPVPDRWLEICDEEGLLIQNEFFVWTGHPQWFPLYAREYDVPELIRQYGDWMRDNWNHPSVVVWDASNESANDLFGSEIIPAVRPLDLSNRPWENSYNPPTGPNDPVEDHPYMMWRGYYQGRIKFEMSEFESMDGRPKPGSLPSDQHAPLVNEYGFLWLHRNGTPTRLTEGVYAELLGRRTMPPQRRLELQAYLLAGKTEFWRAHRYYAGIMHFVFLTGNNPGAYTSDHFRDIERLELHSPFSDYVGEAFKPLGVYINFFQPRLPGGSTRTFTVMLVNDLPKPLTGELALVLATRDEDVLARTARPFTLSDLGDASYEMTIDVPFVAEECILRAIATPEPSSATPPTVSRRWVTITDR